MTSSASSLFLVSLVWSLLRRKAKMGFDSFPSSALEGSARDARAGRSGTRRRGVSLHRPSSHDTSNYYTHVHVPVPDTALLAAVRGEARDYFQQPITQEERKSCRSARGRRTRSLHPLVCAAAVRLFLLKRAAAHATAMYISMNPIAAHCEITARCRGRASDVLAPPPPPR